MTSDDKLFNLNQILSGLTPIDVNGAKSIDLIKPVLARAVFDGRAFGFERLGAGLADVSPDTSAPNLLDDAEASPSARSPDSVQVRDFFAKLPFEMNASQARLLNVRGNILEGSIRDTLGRFVTIEQLAPAKKILVKANGVAHPLMLITKARLPSHAASGISIRRGTVWILAQILVPTAPVGAYVGFRVESGKIKFGAVPTLSGDTITVPSSLDASLELGLATPLDTDDRFQAAPPKRIKFKWKSGVLEVECSKGEASIEAHNFEFKSNGKISYNATYQQVMFGFDVAPQSLDTAVLSASTFEVVGEASLDDAGWAIPLTLNLDPLSLPEATGLAVWVVGFKSDVVAIYEGGAKKGFILSSARLMIWATGFVVLDPTVQRRALGDGHEFQLWMLPGSAHRARLEARLEPIFSVAFGKTDEGPFFSFTASCSSRFDRPISAVGKVIQAEKEPSLVLMQGELGQQSLTILATQLAVPLPVERHMIALENAYLAASKPRFAGLFGKLANGTEVADATALLLIPVMGWVPTLPDPYVGNFSFGRRALEAGIARQQILGIFRWQRAEASFGFLGALAPQDTLWDIPMQGDVSGPAHAPDQLPYQSQTKQGSLGRKSAGFTVKEAIASRGFNQQADIIAARAPSASQDAHFSRAVHRQMPSVSGYMLLDVSTARHQIGVQIGSARWGRDDFARKLGESVSALQMQLVGMKLGTRLADVRVFSLPQIQWEPVRTLDKDQDPITLGIFPSPLASPTDGGPSVMGANVASLVPTIPDLTLDGMMTAYGAGHNVNLVTTLPFGMRAFMTLEPQSAAGRPADEMKYVRPNFIEANRDAVSGGIQVSLVAQSGLGAPGQESPSFKGATLQTLNGVDLATGAPLGISVLGATSGSGGSVETFFNEEFSNARPRVPLTRYDWSGYGASTFSDWSNSKGAFGEVTKAQFQVMVGRTALEVIKVSSILYPWGARLTRSVTVERRGGGGVIRRDSGWQALGPGVFDFTTVSNPTQPFEIHPGLIRGIYDIDRIRPLQNDPILLPDGGSVLPMAFDATVAIEGLAPPGRTRANGLVGFLHIKPLANAISASDFAELIKMQGPIGGPIDAMIDVGGSRLQARAMRIEVGVSEAGGAFRFVGATKVTPELGSSGAWSVVRGPGPANINPDGETMPVPDGIPIVREGIAGTGNGQTVSVTPTGDYRFADPADLFTGMSPIHDYGLLQSDTTHRFLYRRPTIQPGSRKISSAVAPAFADFFAATTSKGLFPPLVNTIELNDRPYSLEINQITGLLKLDPPVDRAAPRTDLMLSASASDAMRVNYNGSRLRFDLHETAWSLDFDAVEVWTDLSFLTGATGARMNLRGGTGRRAQLDRIRNLLHSSIQDLINFLPLMGDTGEHGPVDLGATNLKIAWKITAGLEKILEDPTGFASVRLFAVLDLVGEQDLSPPPAPTGPAAGPLVVSGGGGFTSGYLAARAGYEARFKLKVPPYPVAVVFGWSMEFGGKLVLGGSDSGKVKGLMEITIYVGLAFGTTLGPLKAEVITGAGLIVQQEGTAVGIGGFIFLEIKAEIPLVAKIKVAGEFACLQVQKPTGTYQKWTGEIGINVSVFMIISIKFAANVSDEKRV